MTTDVRSARWDWVQDFRPGGDVMSRAVNSRKPWARGYLKFALRQSRRLADKGFWANSDHPMTNLPRIRRVESGPCVEGSDRHGKGMPPPSTRSGECDHVVCHLEGSSLTKRECRIPPAPIFFIVWPLLWSHGLSD